jgi:hypothetical protein
LKSAIDIALGRIPLLQKYLAIEIAARQTKPAEAGLN